MFQKGDDHALKCLIESNLAETSVRASHPQPLANQVLSGLAYPRVLRYMDIVDALQTLVNHARGLAGTRSIDVDMALILPPPMSRNDGSTADNVGVVHFRHRFAIPAELFHQKHSS